MPANSERPAPIADLALDLRERDHDPFELLLVLRRRQELLADAQVLELALERGAALQQLHEDVICRRRPRLRDVEIDPAGDRAVVARSARLVPDPVPGIVEQRTLS